MNNMRSTLCFVFPLQVSRGQTVFGSRLSETAKGEEPTRWTWNPEYEVHSSVSGPDDETVPSSGSWNKHQPHDGQICEWLLEVLHSLAKKTLVIYWAAFKFGTS